MVKKVTGSGRTSGTTPVQPTKTVESSKVGAVDQVKSAEKKASAGAVSGGAHAITPEIREQLLQLIDEEADRMFGSDTLPERKKEAVKGAVKMAISAGVVDENV
ncbi:MAG: hypothetical protein KDD69_11965 [Bdellovibrionales bacterium]|nr:hypothetical protein [Bdellovibrionales bacterium]